MTTARHRFQETPTAVQHRLLSSSAAGMLDSFATGRWQRVGVRESARCLVIGAGTDAVARWLAGRVGNHGEVVVTDTDPGRVPAHPGVTVLRHDLVADPLVENHFDVIHVRWALACLPGHQELLAKLVAALAPGGVIACDELEPGPDRCLLASPDPAAQPLLERFHRTLEAVLARTGIDPRSRSTHLAMRKAGLIDVDMEMRARSWRGGEPGSMVLHALAGQLAGQLTAAGMSGPDLTDLCRLLRDPRLVIRGCLAVSTIGRKPLPPAGQPCRFREPGWLSPLRGRAGHARRSRP